LEHKELQPKLSFQYISQAVNMEHFSTCGTLHYVVVKIKELTPKQILSVPCPTCGESTGEACELHTGALRNEPHRDRKLSAVEAVETKSSER
jgi:hypothetical protein